MERERGYLGAQLGLALALALAEAGASRATGSLLALACALQSLGAGLGLGAALLPSWLGRAPGGRRGTYGWARVRLAMALARGVALAALGLALVLPEVLRQATAAPRAPSQPLLLAGLGAVGVVARLAGGFGGPGHRSAPEVQDLLGQSLHQPLEEDEEEDAGSCSRLAPALAQAALLLHALAVRALWPPCPGTCPCPPCWATGASRDLCWLLHLDTGLGAGVAAVTVGAAVPGAWAAALVLLQAMPAQLDLGGLQRQLAAATVGSGAAVWGLQLWQLDGPWHLVATAHFWCPETSAYGAVAARLCQALHEHGVCHTTLQPHFGGPGGLEEAVGRPSICVEYETTV